MNIVVWFSCGAASAVAARVTLDKYPDANVRIVNNPIPEEHSDNRRFLRDCEKWLGVSIESATNPKYMSCVDVWEKRKFMSGPKGAPCTHELKKKARQIWEADNKCDFMVLGFTFDEIKRSERFKLLERDNLLSVLIDEKITKSDCFNIIQKAGIQLPASYREGFPNVNCIGCVKATSPTYWNHVRKIHPNVFAERAKMSDKLGTKLVRVKGERIKLSQLDPSAQGRPLKRTGVECGIFCEETAINKE